MEQRSPEWFNARKGRVTGSMVGAVLGVGLARGISSIDLGVVGRIIVSWVVTLPVGAGLSILFFFTLKGIFS